uniref:ribosomal protein S3 n=1 Tax=Malassezia cuniculi TaxID=948313 RepID=UPI00300343C0|nr:ribosomal protein S3 [Malassezia cuniculi]
MILFTLFLLLIIITYYIYLYCIIIIKFLIKLFIIKIIKLIILIFIIINMILIIKILLLIILLILFSFKKSIKTNNSIFYTPIIISKPSISHTNNNIYINIFYFINNSNSKIKDKNINYNNNNNNSFNSNDKEIFNNKIVNLSKILSVIYNKSVKINITRINYPYLNSNILAKYLSINANTNTFQHFVESIITYPNLNPTGYNSIYDNDNFTLPSFITDITIQLSGRLVTEKAIPRVTKKISRISSDQVSLGTKLKQFGYNENSERNIFIDKSSFTSKNHLGSFTIKVIISSIITNT